MPVMIILFAIVGNNRREACLRNPNSLKEMRISILGKPKSLLQK